MKEVQREAERHKVKLLILTAIKAIASVAEKPNDTNAILPGTAQLDPVYRDLI